MTATSSPAKASLVLVPVLIVGAVTGCATDVVASRFRAMPPQDSVIAAGDWYRPVSLVGGGSGGNLAVGPPSPAEVMRFAPVLVTARNWDSLAVVVVQDGRIVFENYAAPTGPSFRFDSQSMHRALLALAIGAAIGEGRITSIDERAAEQLPEWRADSRNKIALRDLLYHQSGFVDPPYAFAVDSPGMQMFIGADIERLTLAQRATAAPGVAFRANALDAQVLGLVLERATGLPYAKFISSRIWQPIGASSAYVRLDHARGHARTFCCIQATARDWARIGQLMLDHGRVGDRQLIRPEWIAQLLTASTLNPAFGAFWVLKPTPLTPRSVAATDAPLTATPFESPDVFYAGGRGGQRVYVIPSRRAVVVRFGRIRNDFDDGAFLNPVLRVLQ